MRPIEILLVLANLLAFFSLVIPLPRVVRWMRYIVPLAVLMFIAQMLIEGARWAMIPVYVLTGLFFLIWLWKNFASTKPFAERKWTHRVVVYLVVILGVIGLAVSIAPPIILPVFQFPTPSGPYAVGTVTYHWTDTNRPELFSTDPNARRELMVQIWYPTQKVSSSTPAPYLQTAEAVATAEARLHSWPSFLIKQLAYVQTHSSESAPIAANKPSYPVLIYLEGFTGYRQMTTFQVEELVSHGYIVVGLDQPGAAATVVFPDGHQIAIGEGAVPPVPQMELLINQSFAPATTTPTLNGQAMPNGIIPYFAQDVSFVLDQLVFLNTTDPQGILTGKLDLVHTGIFGISLGGAVGAEACVKDPRIKACLIEDVAMPADVVQTGLQQPTMFITRPAATIELERQTAGGWPEAAIIQTLATMRAVYTSLQRDGYYVQVPGAYHIDFTDLNLLSPFLPTIGISGPIGAERAHDIVNAYSVAFFDKELMGATTTLLDVSLSQYPEVIFETRKH